VDLKERISAAVEERREDIIKLLQELVRVPSVVGSGREGEAQVIVSRELRKLGVEPDVWEPDMEELRRHKAFVPVERDYKGRPNAVAVVKGTGGGRSLAFNGHVDVVPVDDSTSWTHDPWSGERVENKIYGRGSADMKGGVVAGLVALQVLKDLGVRLKGDVQFWSVSDEEDGGNTTLACILRGYRADATVFLEPTGTAMLFCSSRGAQFFRIRVKGEEGAVEYRYDIPNAIEKAVKVFQAVEAYANWRESQAADPLYQLHPTKVPVAVCKIQAGAWPSTVPGECVMEGTLECLPGEEIREVRERFREYVRQAAGAADPWLKQHPPEVEWFGLMLEAASSGADAPIVEAVQAAAEAFTGQRPLAVGGGGSDLRLPVLYADSQSVLFGPAGGPVHSVDEWVDIDQVVTATKVAALLACRWCGVSN